MSFAIDLSIELDSIRNFFEQNVKDIDADILEIESNWDDSQAETEDDFGNLMYKPMMREEITLRATYYELNALIEHHLQNFAVKPSSKSSKAELMPKSLLSDPEAQIRRLKLVTDRKLHKIIALVQRYYDFSFDDIPHFASVKHIREIANSFKHRRGLKDFRRDPKGQLFQRHELDRESTRTAIKDAHVFLLEVHRKVKGPDLRSDFPEDDDNGA